MVSVKSISNSNNKELLEKNSTEKHFSVECVESLKNNENLIVVENRYVNREAIIQKISISKKI